MPTTTKPHIRMSGPDFAAFAAAAKSADKKIIAEMRRGLRVAGERTAADVRREVGQVPSRRGRGRVRGALAKGTRVSISVARPRTAGVTIVTDPRYLPPSKRVLARKFNYERFRRMVFGNRDVWVTQQGHPYFHATILRNQAEMTGQVWRALKAAEYQVMAKNTKQLEMT